MKIWKKAITAMLALTMTAACFPAETVMAGGAETQYREEKNFSEQKMSAGFGNEKLLDLSEDYDELLVSDLKRSFEKTVWKGDVLNAKMIVLAQNEDLHQVEIIPSDFADQKGNMISADQVSVNWLKEVRANNGRNLAGTVKSYPDMIHKGGTTDILAKSVKFAWVQVNIPENAKSGIYQGTFRISAGEIAEPVEVTMKIEVLNLVQPEPEMTEIQIWQHPFSVANYYLDLGKIPSGGISNEIKEEFYFTEEHFNLMRASTEEYASMGGHDAVANIVEEAWNHQSYYNDLSMVKWKKKTDGSWEFDYTWYDAWIGFMIECGVLEPEKGIGQIKCYSIVPWNNQIAYYDEAAGKMVKISRAPGSAGWKEMWEPFLRDFMEHSKKMGWFDITYISMDERGLDQLRPAVDMIESVTDENGNHFKISSALNYAAPQYYDFTDRINDISINLGNAGNVQQMNELSAHRKERGLTTTYYTCTGDYPSNFMISDPGDNYWGILYSMTLGTDGYMRWAWDNYVYDMHGDASYRYWEPGDGWFIYPAERETVDMSQTVPFYSTPRYEMLKQGMRDAAKAKYLMLQNDEMNQQIRELVSGIKCPAKGFANGSAVAASPADRMLVHSETDRIYEEISKISREYADSLIPENPFSDVMEDAYFYKPVLWAVKEGITTGVGDTGKFKPDDVCSRAHVVTFLWKKAGCPEPSGDTDRIFEDVTKDDYFYKAVLWAAEQGITTGIGNSGRFEPYRDCSRAHVVTFLWRAAGHPGVPEDTKIPFSDVKEDDYFYHALRWAAANDIAQGFGTTGKFVPDGNCTRANAVTFLYRAAGKPFV